MYYEFNDLKTNVALILSSNSNVYSWTLMKYDKITQA